MKQKQGFIIAIAALLIVILAILVFPLCMMIYGSLMTNDGSTFTFSNYMTIFKEKLYLQSMWNSILVSILSSLIALVLTAIATYAIAEKSKKFKEKFLVIANLTSNFAGIPLAFAFIILLGNTGVFVLLDKGLGLDLLDGFSIYSFTGIILIYIYFQIPLGIMLLFPIYEGIDKRWKEAASLLGASNTQYWSKIAFPNLLPSFVGVFTIMFANSMGAYASAYALTGSSYNLLAIRIGNSVAGDIFAQPEIAAALAVVLAVILLINMLANEYILKHIRRDLK